MVYSNYSTDNYKALKISIGTIIRNPELLRFVSDHLKTKKICKHDVKKLPLVIRYVPDQCKTQKMLDKAIVENDGTLRSVSDCYKRKFVIKLMILILLQYHLFLNAIRLKKCVIK